jgi:integrase
VSQKTSKPAPKRGNGRGSVRRLQSGRWQWRATITLPNGALERVAGTVKTKTEAEETLSRVVTDAGRGEYTVSRETTLAEYIGPWLTLRAAAGGQAAKYVRNQRCLAETHIIPAIGKKKLTSITARDLQLFYAGLQCRDKRRQATLGQPLGDSMKRSIHILLHQLFAEAVRDGDLSKNPADLVRPRYTRQAALDAGIKSWTPEEAERFYVVARTSRWGVIFCFMMSTGLRIGEALGLRWTSVDLGKQQIVIQEALVSLSGKMHRTTPKTARSRRTLPVSGDALAILSERPQQALLDREAEGERYVGSDAVFTNTLGKPILPDNIYRIMRQLCAQAGVPYLGTHVARHTFTSMLGVNGVPIEVVSAHLGHAKASFTLDRYRTVFQSERQDITLDFTVKKVAPKGLNSGD